MQDCQYRLENEDGRHKCFSNCLLIPSGIVTESMCNQCGVANKKCLPVNRSFKPKKDEVLAGDLLEKALQKAGITQRRVSKWLGKPCGCSERKEKLNRLHAWAKDWLSGNRRTLNTTRREFTRNLIMHVYPVAGKDGWRENARIIRNNKKLFNGKRVIAIATNPNPGVLDSPDEVREAFGDGFEFMEYKNVKVLRETRTFAPLMEKVESTDPNEATFYCHSKGSTHNIDEGTTPNLWRDAMYETLLNWDAVSPSLSDYPIVGSFKKYVKILDAPWHYSGTFFWFRNKDTFSRDWRGAIRQKWIGVEAWPGTLFDRDEAGCVFGDGTIDLYSMDYWKESIIPELEKWRKEYGQSTTLHQ